MENFNENIPSNWNTTTSTAVSKESAQGRVHSGNYSVALKDKAKLYQDVSINGGCFYNFSFFAHGEGAIVSVEATVTFVNQNNVKTQGLKISVRAQDIIAVSYTHLDVYKRQISKHSDGWIYLLYL